jgi:hypothetical protein
MNVTEFVRNFRRNSDSAKLNSGFSLQDEELARIEWKILCGLPLTDSDLEYLRSHGELSKVTVMERTQKTGYCHLRSLTLDPEAVFFSSSGTDKAKEQKITFKKVMQRKAMEELVNERKRKSAQIRG